MMFDYLLRTESTVSVTWKTKFGGRRVRQEPPTIGEAIAVAQSMSEDREQQVEIAASLMGIDAGEVRAQLQKVASRPERTITAVAPGRMRLSRPVVVEYRNSRRAG